MIKKPGTDGKVPSNYRPISLTSNLAKIYEKLILQRITNHMRATNFISPAQFGFREHHSTHLQLLRVVEHIKQCKHQPWRRSVIALFLDVAKAFDKVRHVGLLAKMLKAGFPQSLIRIIHSYLSARTCYASLEGVESRKVDITAGTPQGGVLSAYLFLIYINDFPAPPMDMLALYADDAAVIFSGANFEKAKKKLLKYIPAIEQWCIEWRVCINILKSHTIAFGRNQTPLGVTIFGQPVPAADNTTYLGIIIDRRLDFQMQTKRAIAKTLSKYGALYSILRKSSELSLECKLAIYKSVLRPTLLYGSAAWIYHSKETILKIQRTQNRILRNIAQAPLFMPNWRLHRELKIPSAIEFALHETRKIIHQSTRSQFAHIRNIFDYPRSIEKPFPRRPGRLEALLRHWSLI